MFCWGTGKQFTVVFLITNTGQSKEQGSLRPSEARSVAPFRVVCQQIQIADWVNTVTFGMTVQQITAALLGSAAGKSLAAVAGMYFLLYL